MWAKRATFQLLWELTRVPLKLRKAATPSVLLPSRLEGLESKAVGRG